EKAAKVFVRNELVPLQKRLIELNTWINQNIVSFNDYILDQDKGI
ncbi:TPA: phage portal protein, partial [Klebsiella pneumoniae]|nr:Presumed portal vertex protein [Klebsiella pneumoniae]